MPISSLRPRVLASLLALGAIGAAQAFPDGATTPSASALAQHLNDRVFGTALADGTALRIEFKSSGYLFIDTSRGRNLKGEWKAEDGRLCAKMNGDDVTSRVGSVPGRNASRIVCVVVALGKPPVR